MTYKAVILNSGSDRRVVSITFPRNDEPKVTEMLKSAGFEVDSRRYDE